MAEQVRRIVLSNIESHLRIATESAETVRELQDELQTSLEDYSREKARFDAGEIAKDVFRDLTDQHRRKVNIINVKMGERCREAIAALKRAELEVTRNAPGRRRERRARVRARSARRTRRR